MAIDELGWFKDEVKRLRKVNEALRDDLAFIRQGEVGNALAHSTGLEILLDHATGFAFYPKGSDDDPDRYAWRVTVEKRGDDTWAVLRNTACWGANGKWGEEPIPSNRTEAWKRAHRFSRDEAVKIAKEALATIRVRGMTYAQWADKRAGEKT